MLAPFLDDPLFGGTPGPGLTGSHGLIDITFAGQRHVMPLGGSVEKATGRDGISQREEREMGIFRQSQADRLVAVRRGMDRGTHTEADLIAERMRSTGQELDDAMQQYDEDDYESWGH